MGTTTIAEFMGQDHDRLDDLFKQFQTIKRQDTPKARSLFQEFMTGLHRHIVWEEDILFPEFEAQAEMVQNHGPTAVMRREHREIKDFLAQIYARVTAGDPMTDEAEQGLLKVLTAHNVKEEQILYPWIDNALKAGQRMTLLAKMKELPPDHTAHCCE